MTSHNKIVRPNDAADYAPTVVTLKADTRLVRIYNAANARKNGYGPDSFNPNPIHPDKPTTRGRFNSTRRDVFSLMYAAEHEIDERVAIMELIDYLQCTPISGGYSLVTSDLVRDLEFVYLTLDVDLQFVELRTKPQLRRICATERSIYGTNYQISRAWSRHVHHSSLHARGIRYKPVQYGDTDAGCALAIYGDRLPLSIFRGPPATVPLLSDAGRDIMINCSEGTGFVPAW